MHALHTKAIAQIHVGAVGVDRDDCGKVRAVSNVVRTCSQTSLSKKVIKYV